MKKFREATEAAQGHTQPGTEESRAPQAPTPCLCHHAVDRLSLPSARPGLGLWVSVPAGIWGRALKAFSWNRDQECLGIGQCVSRSVFVLAKGEDVDKELQDPRGVSACLCLKGQDGFPAEETSKRGYEGEEGRFQARGMAWERLRPERAWHVLWSQLKSVKDQV